MGNASMLYAMGLKGSSIRVDFKGGVALGSGA
jgi:hypothetical protein